MTGNWSFPCPVACGGGVFWVADCQELDRLVAALVKGRYGPYEHWRSREHAIERLNAMLRIRK